MLDGITQAGKKLVKIFFVQEYFVFHILSIIESALAFCDDQVIIVATGGLYIKKYVRLPALIFFE